MPEISNTLPSTDFGVTIRPYLKAESLKTGVNQNLPFVKKY